MFGRDNQNGQPQPDPNKGQPAAVFKYRCVTTCTFRGKFYREGDIIALAEKKAVPHFALVEELKMPTDTLPPG